MPALQAYVFAKKNWSSDKISKSDVSRKNNKIIWKENERIERMLTAGNFCCLSHCGFLGGCCQMDTWFDQVGLGMRNIIKKEDGEGKLKLYNDYDVRAHWDFFSSQDINDSNNSYISPKRNLTPRLSE